MLATADRTADLLGRFRAPVDAYLGQIAEKGAAPDPAGFLRALGADLDPDLEALLARVRRSYEDRFRHPLVGQTVGGYRLDRKLGSGGMGAVFESAHPVTGVRCAVKLIARDFEGADLRFREEALALQTLDHPNLIRVLEVGIDPKTDRPFLVTEYLAGCDLQKLLDAGGPLDPADAVAVVAAAAAGLRYAHDRGYVHRDVKPSNVMLDAAGRVKVTDFGLALAERDSRPALSRAGHGVGTAAYWSPEQAAGGPTDARTDGYALGKVLYQLLTNRLPPPRPDDPAADWSGVPPALVTVVRKAAAQRAADRYPAVTDLAAAAVAAVAGPLTETPEPSRALFDRVDAWVRDSDNPVLDGLLLGKIQTTPAAASTVPLAAAPSRRRFLAAGGAVVAAAGAGVAWWRPWRSEQPSPSPPTVVPPPASGRGQVELFVWGQPGEMRDHLGLRDPGALPLRPGDRVRIEATLRGPGYPYVIWIAADGTPAPLYPWKDWDWGRRMDEKPLPRLSWPDWVNGVSDPLKPGPSGLETMVVLVRQAPLDPATDLRRYLPKRAPVRSRLYQAVWLEDGHAVLDRDELAPVRSAPSAGGHAVADDPVTWTEGVLRSGLKDHFDYILSVSFDFDGPERGGP